METSKNNIGKRVQLHPATDHWMRGDRYGEIVGPGNSREYKNRHTGEIDKLRPYRVKLDKSGKIVRVLPENLFEVY